jgi:hypothetical protein
MKIKSKSLLFLLVLFPLFYSNCLFVSMGPGVKGDGEIRSKPYTLDVFDVISIAGDFKVNIVEGGDFTVAIVSDQNLHDHIIVKQKNKNLEISIKDNVNLKPTQPITIAISCQGIQKLVNAGSGEVLLGNVAATSGLELSNAGSGQIIGKFETEKLNISIAGSGNVMLNTSVQSLKLSIAGSGSLDAPQLTTIQADINIIGSGNAFIGNIADQLNASILGSGDVSYQGGPTVKQSLIGSGKLINRDL